ncbi:GNAT family N-acetyltransferase [Halobacillus litoralis]|uniref:GNAT family N-acetyltransferase n=1 Tax=Halobacillus litoralis TaxID=45668 RepID=A0A845F9G1_9BACI|nr:GNAT family N-acetyltransferase [Halobacillus litoralis]MYL70305.1 GNAT family N-acetyltransferase [Halobacillus litoralis]
MDIIKVKNKQQKDDAFYVRRVVFVEEQQVPLEIEIDEFDDSAIHFVGYEGKQPVAASRLRFVHGFGKLERICVLKDYRGQSLGKQIIDSMEEVIRDYAYDKAKLNAQTQAESFYESLGYVTISDTFMDAGIPHVTMVKKL